MNYGRFSIAMFLIFGLLMFGCIGIGEQPKPQTQAKTASEAPSPPQVVKRPDFEMASPLDGAVIKTGGDSADVTVAVETSNLVLTPSGGKNKAGEGHFHMTLDGKEIITAQKQYTFEKVELGEHTLKVEIKQNDQTSYVPKIVKTITFKVEKEVAKLVHAEYTVEIEGFRFDPAEITAKVGDTITWKNNDKMPHTATSIGNFDTGTIMSGSSKSITLEKEGTYDYICTLYPSMKGKLIVTK